MNIGEIKPVNGRLIGHIATRSIDLPRLGLRPVESTNERAPVFEIVALNVGQRWVQIGALWEATANKTGECFLQGSLDDPSLAEPLPIALFGSDAEGYRVAWRRRDALSGFGGQRSERPAMGGEAMGGFGASTAGMDGSYMGGSDFDDEVPH
jgi:uncharacterized protein (DUF736 family)